MPAYISHPACLLHEMGGFHPERPSRLMAIEERLTTEGIMARLERHEAPLASDDLLTLAHGTTHVAHIRAVSPASGRAVLDPDTSMNPMSLEAALHAVGGAALAVDLVMKGGAKAAFCNIRPPGHHATRDAAMGFCLFNNAAIAARYAIERHGVRRIAIVDFDVHHGNGTEDICKDDDRVMLCSSFQHPFYPYSPLERIGSNLRIVKSPLIAGADGDDLKRVVEVWWRHWEDFRPEFVIVSAGFDAHEDDPVGGLKWRERDYAWITGEIRSLADKYASGRIVSCLEGGYDLEALAACACRHVAGIMF